MPMYVHTYLHLSAWSQQINVDNVHSEPTAPTGGSRFRTLISYRLTFRSRTKVRYRKSIPVPGRGASRLRPNPTVMVVSRTHAYPVPGGHGRGISVPSLPVSRSPTHLYSSGYLPSKHKRSKLCSLSIICHYFRCIYDVRLCHSGSQKLCSKP
jgi:hypothetical protein